MPPIKFTVRKRFHLLQCKTRTLDSGREHLAHYRLIFVISGEGKFVLNREIHSYSSGGVIFLEPDQQPMFQEDRGTEILMIAFDTHLAEDFQRKKAYSPDFADIYKQVENLCKNIRLIQGKPVKNDRDAQTVNYLVNQISFELSQQSSSFIKLIRSSIELIVTILARNNFECKKAEEKPLQHNLSESMIGYVKSQIQQNKSIRIGELLMKFNISEEAANLCMLNHTGMSLRNFIFKYKADLFKSRMLKMDISEFSARL
ncbi:AraC family ligand binding domain-containing protein [Dyadobacter sp. CY107]|uniref:AraC family ligand binding domain-containing protein n=1 Tax=Dyadobacter fanqingshengii TaxID=2906443 RepID=UPI001F342700|nr:AraC family ligand binding domain-containing protein [Dyadobacter fanqingshengii]MCF2502677.1 AraC family ligand binding domain-containing protein [Dyadobacter fanqingshengii]